MRLDKYLKVSRLIKRRPVANEACDAGRILVNDKVAKASLNVKPGDVIEIANRNQIFQIILARAGTPIDSPTTTNNIFFDVSSFLFFIFISFSASILLCSPCSYIKKQHSRRNKKA